MALPWTCSICALRCDDLRLERDPQRIVVKPACALAAQRLNRWSTLAPRQAAVHGQAVDWEQALSAAAGIVQNANRLSIVGSPPDFQTARAAIDLAAASGAVLEFASTPTLQALAAAVARDGLTTATLGDVRQHADRIVWVGRPDHRLPRLRERFTSPDLPTLCVLPQGYQDRADGADETTLRLETGCVDWLRSVLLELQRRPSQDILPGEDTSGGDTTGEDTTGEDTTGAVGRLLSFLGESRYVAFVLADDALSTDDERPAASWWLRLVEQLGQTRRCVLLMPDDGAAARQTLLWRTGFSGAVHFVDRTPSLSVAPQRCDATIRLRPSLAHADDERPATSGDESPTVLLGDQGTPDAWVAAAHVFLPVGWAGSDHAGTTVRGDGTVTLALQPLPDAVLPDRNPHRAADVLAEFSNRFAQQERA